LKFFAKQNIIVPRLLVSTWCMLRHVNMNGNTIPELQAQIQSLLRQIEELGFPLEGYESEGSLEKENERIERYLSDFTHRQGVLLTIAGLLSLFPVFEVEGILRYFLIWIIPFLVLAVVAHILSSKRINIVSKLKVSAPPPNSRKVNEILKRHYHNVLKFHKTTDAALVAFFVSFIVSFYIFIFKGSPEITTSILVTFIAILLGILRYFHGAGISNNTDSDISDFIAVGAPGPLPDHDILLGGYKPQDSSDEEKKSSVEAADKVSPS